MASRHADRTVYGIVLLGLATIAPPTTAVGGVAFVSKTPSSDEHALQSATGVNAAPTSTVTRGTISLKGSSPGPANLLPVFQVGIHRKTLNNFFGFPQIQECRFECMHGAAVLFFLHTSRLLDCWTGRVIEHTSSAMGTCCVCYEHDLYHHTDTCSV